MFVKSGAESKRVVKAQHAWLLPPHQQHPSLYTLSLSSTNSMHLTGAGAQLLENELVYIEKLIFCPFQSREGSDEETTPRQLELEQRLLEATLR